MHSEPEIDYLPGELPAYGGNLLSDNIARIESLKVKILEWPGLNELEIGHLLRELDILRGSMIQMAGVAAQSYAATREMAVSPLLPGGEPANLKIEDLGIIGQNKQIEKVLKIIGKVAPTNLTLLLEGETGSGKELFARIIHLNSNRKKFVAVNCGAFPSDIIESELFGHVKGAFTGATSDRKGKFEEADGGTIFLDEIGDLELQAQVKLLRVLEVGDLQRVGSDKTVKVNVKVIADTLQDFTYGKTRTRLPQALDPRATPARGGHLGQHRRGDSGDHHRSPRAVSTLSPAKYRDPTTHLSRTEQTPGECEKRCGTGVFDRYLEKISW